MAERSHQFREMKTARERTIIIPGLSSERREYTPVGLLSQETVVSLTAFAIYDGPLYCLALLSTKVSFIWNFTVSGKMKRLMPLRPVTQSVVVVSAFLV
jgi:restriction-modification enzyme MmeI-like protein